MSVAITSRAIRTDPDVFGAMADELDRSAVEGGAQLIGAAFAIDGYAAANSGPDIDVVVASGRAVIDGYQATLAALGTVEAALRTAAAELGSLEAESDALWARAATVDSGDRGRDRARVARCRFRRHPSPGRRGARRARRRARRGTER